MLKLLTFLLTTLLFTGSASAFNPACEQIHFQGDEAVISGYSPSTDWVCYKLEIDEPITLSMTLVADHALLTVLQNDDFQFEEEKAVAFLTRHGPLEVRVGPPYRSPSDDFKLTVRRHISATEMNWKKKPQSFRHFQFSAISEDGQTYFNGACWARLPGIGFNILHKGRQLLKSDDKPQSVDLVIDGTKGETLRKKIIVSYYWEEELHTFNKHLDKQVLNAFAAGRRMKLINDKGNLIASFDLNGSSDLRREILESCGY